MSTPTGFSVEELAVIYALLTSPKGRQTMLAGLELARTRGLKEEADGMALLLGARERAAVKVADMFRARGYEPPPPGDYE